MSSLRILLYSVEKLMKQFSVLLACLMLSLPAVAVISVQDAARLGQDLTPVGAEKAGNGRDIPAWTGGLPKAANHLPGAFHNDPFATDKPRFRINAANVQQHRQRLTAGQVALLERFPDLYFEVYPTRRSASYPQYVYDGIKTNATRARLMKYGAGVTGATMSSPFPIPSEGLEVLWNHTLRFRGHSLGYTAMASAVTSGGNRMDALREYQYFMTYSMPGATRRIWTTTSSTLSAKPWRRHV